MTEDRPAAGAGLTFTEESELVPTGTVTLVEGASFAICDRTGDILPDTVQGVFVGDTRVCSELILTVDDGHTEALTVAEPSPFQATFVARTRDRELLVVRELHVSRGMRMDLRVENLTQEPRHCSLRLTVGADLADLFAVKEGRANPTSAPPRMDGKHLVLADATYRRGLRVQSTEGTVVDNRLEWEVALQPREVWNGCVELSSVRGGHALAARFRCGESVTAALPTTRQQTWSTDIPRIATDVPHLATTFDQASTDLGALRLFDLDHPEDPLIAAGAPWFMTLFGRDSIFTSWMALMLDPTIALGTVHALARLQGRDQNPETEEEPGRILHEVRFSTGPSLALADGDVYYGTADATPLFVMLVHELWRWGASMSEIEPLLPAVDRALEWIVRFGDRDDDGYIEYAPSTSDSLANQGWKDSWDGISFANGDLPKGPIALAEVQGYAYAAWRAGAELAAATGDHIKASARRAWAESLQSQFERDFWMPEQQAFALALDGDKKQVDAIASNMGHLLWSGIVRRPEQRGAVARWLVSAEMFSGWGIRTLAPSMHRYNPLSYHNGSVWPHDTAIGIDGLRRAGYVDEALKVASGLLAAAGMAGGRLPELFAGLSASEVDVPVPYPASCSPQAWAAASPLLVVRGILGLEPDIPHHTITVSPRLPEGATTLEVENLPIGDARIAIKVEGDGLAVQGLPRGITLLRRSD